MASWHPNLSVALSSSDWGREKKKKTKFQCALPPFSYTQILEPRVEHLSLNIIRVHQSSRWPKKCTKVPSALTLVRGGSSTTHLGFPADILSKAPPIHASPSMKAPMSKSVRQSLSRSIALYPSAAGPRRGISSFEKTAR